MSRQYRLALLVLIPSAVIALANAWAFRAFPQQWGGPNIGGGLLQLLAYVGVVAGLVLLAVAVATKRRSRPTR